ncbi:SPOR domain-containing protein [Candidatus Atribacteria bacterium MT.SAG.1]|nr:SPOR domain-containing protein [Candidatus Atribacteria bacterium MT.SAG.1]
MRKASRIYKRKSRSNLETLIILIGAIIILGVAFYLAREKSYIPPEAQVITEEKEEEIQVIEVPIEVSQKITVEKVEEGEESLEIVIKKEAVSEEKLPITEPTMVKIPEVESGVNVLKESEIATEKKIFTVQVGAFSKEKNAQNLAKEISDKGYQTYVVKGKTLYKVQVGEFKSYEEAQNVSQKLKESGYPIFVTTR